MKRYPKGESNFKDQPSTVHSREALHPQPAEAKTSGAREAKAPRPGAGQGSSGGSSSQSGSRGGPAEPEVPSEVSLDPRGIFSPRTRRLPGADLIDPRRPVWEDEIAALRQALMDRAQSQEKGAAPKIPSDIPAAIYRYSKGPDFVNDEIGYGEMITETLWQIQGDRIVEIKRVSQRTKTGRQVLMRTPAGKPDTTPEGS
jgi:hypothetical protein